MENGFMEALVLTNFLPAFTKPEITFPQIFSVRYDFGQDIIQMFIDITQILRKIGA
jgi:hypothetical protein